MNTVGAKRIYAKSNKQGLKNSLQDKKLEKDKNQLKRASINIFIIMYWWLNNAEEIVEKFNVLN